MEHLSVPDATGSESKAERRLRKETERAAESTPLDPWERYRALNDLVDHMLDVIEMADRRTRFALAQARARQMGLANEDVVAPGADDGGEICGVAKGLRGRHDSARTDRSIPRRVGAASHGAFDRVRIVDLHTGASIPE
jgi:hypothetical protein